MFFPQLATGALVQYPIERSHLEHVISNRTEDGRSISLANPAADRLCWESTYSSLSRAEASSLISFFQSCEGSLQNFAFVDPTANLVLYSQDFSQPVWQRNALLTLVTGIGDPLGGNAATRVNNTSAGDLDLIQSIPMPGSFSTVFSIYLRAATPVTVTVSRSDGSSVRSTPIAVTPVWSRYSLSSTFASSISQSNDYALNLSAGSVVDVFGAQVETQAVPGKYLATTGISSVYPACRFRDDQLQVVATGPNQYQAVVAITTPANQ